MPAARWPWPGRSATRPGRRWPWRDLSLAAHYAGDHDEAVRLARQAGQITAGIPGSIARTCSYCADQRADRCRGPGRRRARLRGGPGPVPGTRATCGTRRALLPRMADLDLRAGRTGDAAAHLREGLQLAVRTGSWFELLNGLCQCGHLCAATGRPAEALTLWAACAALGRHEGFTDPPWYARRREEPLREARQALGPGRARAAEDRGAAMSLATAAEYALMLTDPGPPPPRGAGPGAAQRPGTGAGHPGRPGPHQRPDRRPAVHQRPHRRLAPGPDPGQDRLPPPRRPDPPGPDRGPGLAVLPRPARLPSPLRWAPAGCRCAGRLRGVTCRPQASTARMGGLTPPPERGNPPLPRAMPGGRACAVRPHHRPYRAFRRRPCSHTLPAGDHLRGRRGGAACAGSPRSWPRSPAACWPRLPPSRPPSR